MTTYTDRLGRVKEFTYLNNNLLSTEVWRASAGGTIVNTKTYTYNANDQLLTAADNFGTYTLTYDNFGRLATQQDPHGKTLTFSYDTADRLTSVADSLGGTRTLGYDNADRLTSIQYSDSSSQLRVNFTHNDRDELTQIDRYTDTAGTTLVSKTLLAYDDGGRLTSITHKDGSNATVDSFAYQYDSDNRLTQETSTLGPTRNFTYDKTDQLTSDGTNNYSFDANGNRTMSGYSTGAGNRLTTDGTWNYYFDAEGNLTSKVNISTTETWLYYYNHDNQLTKAEHKAISTSAVDQRLELTYDVFGQRGEMSVDTDGDGSGSPVVTKFAYEAGNIWADLSSSGSLITRRIYGFGLDSLIARIGSSGNEDWYLTDRLGSIRDIVNSSGTLIDHRDYEPYGKIVNETSPSNGDRYGFTSREQLPLVALIDYRARIGNPDTGGFLQQDPSGFSAGDANLYRYVGNSPANATDPTGLQERVQDDGSNLQWITRNRMADLVSNGLAHSVTVGATAYRVVITAYGDEMRAFVYTEVTNPNRGGETQWAYARSYGLGIILDQDVLRELSTNVNTLATATRYARATRNEALVGSQLAGLNTVLTGISMLPGGAAADALTRGNYVDATISFVGDVALLGATRARGVAAAARGGSRLASANRAVARFQAVEGAIAVTRVGQAGYAIVQGENGAAASYIGEALLRIFGTAYARRVAPRPLSRPAGYTRMQDHIPHLDNPATAATTQLTPQQAFALQENLQAIGSQTVPGVRASIASGRNVDAWQSIQRQLNLPRFRFIDQVPGGRAAIDAILREFPNLTFPH